MTAPACASQRSSSSSRSRHPRRSALAVAGARTARRPRRRSRDGGTLAIGLAEDPDALDPTLARTFVGRMVFLHMCEKLYDLIAKLQIVPQLAAALPQISKDKLTYTIQLRSGIKFNDGTALNAPRSRPRSTGTARSRAPTRASELSPVDSVDVTGARSCCTSSSRSRR